MNSFFTENITTNCLALVLTFRSLALALEVHGLGPGVCVALLTSLV